METIKALLNIIRQIPHNHFCGDIRQLDTIQIQPLENVADFITCFQAILNSALGINLAYLPVSLLSQSRSFLSFVTSIIEDAIAFADSYTNAISKQGKTLRPLTLEPSKCLAELPFWLICPEGKRASLYVRYEKSSQIKISTGSVELGNLNLSSQTDTAEQLKRILKLSGYRLRPKAVSLTVFVRQFLADWFIHGRKKQIKQPKYSEYKSDSAWKCPIDTYSQLKNMSNSNQSSLLEKVEVVCRYFGLSASVKYAEPFISYEPICINELTFGLL